MSKVEDALEKTRHVNAQTKVEIAKGMNVRRTKGGIPVFSIHYTADPNKSKPEWKDTERKTYSSHAAWEREMEMVDEAGGGELVFADTLITYWDKIVISDPSYKPPLKARVEGGFDHGLVNPCAYEKTYIDEDGTIIFCGEYYQPNKEIWEHAPILKTMQDIRFTEVCYADPSIFPETLQQSQTHSRERAKSVNELWCEQGIELFSKYRGDRSDVSFAARLMMHWKDLDNRMPTVRIVCRNFSEQPQPGLHNWDCPNLLWELMRTRRVKSTAVQLMKSNPSEAIVDKDNHARDAAKYLVMSHPEPAMQSAKDKAAEKAKELAKQHDLTSALIRYNQQMDQAEGQGQPPRLGRHSGR